VIDLLLYNHPAGHVGRGTRLAEHSPVLLFKYHPDVHVGTGWLSFGGVVTGTGVVITLSAGGVLVGTGSSLETAGSVIWGYSTVNSLLADSPFASFA